MKSLVTGGIKKWALFFFFRRKADLHFFQGNNFVNVDEFHLHVIETIIIFIQRPIK